MATPNYTDGNIWTFFDVSTSAENAKLSGRHQILGIFWTEDEATARDIAADDDLIITDGDDVRIIGKRAAGTPATASNDLILPIADPGLPVVGFKVAALDGGVLTVWAKPPYS